MFKHSDKVYLGVDVGGSHISAALVRCADGAVVEETLCRGAIDAQADPPTLLRQWVATLEGSLQHCGSLQGIGIAMPGPFDYRQGISLIQGLSKYEALYGCNIKASLRGHLKLDQKLPIVFENDATCFGLGEAIWGVGTGYRKIIAITLGTGLGATFIENGQALTERTDIPPGGVLYNVPFKEGMAEDYISSRWLLNTYNASSASKAKDVKEIASSAIFSHDALATTLFEQFGSNLALCLMPWIQSFRPDCLVIGGSIAQSSHLFVPSLTNILKQYHIENLEIKISNKMEMSTLAGAAGLVLKEQQQDDIAVTSWRKSSQPLMPYHTTELTQKAGAYNCFPFHSLGTGAIFSGYDGLAKWIATQKSVLIDGFAGVDFSVIREELSRCFSEDNVSVIWYEASAFMKDASEIERLVAPLLGTKDSVWGTKTSLTLADFFDVAQIASLQPSSGEAVHIVIGTGAALVPRDIPVIYVDLPKNELQYRMRAGSITNIGATGCTASTSMYKRFYFVDWVVLAAHRQAIKDRIAIVADGQWKDPINWAFHASLQKGLHRISRSVLRVRPWFEAGAWGGQWMKAHIPSINQEEVNYAWSFELIVPENGLVFESDGNLLEVAFDWLMEQEATNVLGAYRERFHDEFPIRFDFLDTFSGGNLSIQCHPTLSYIRENFGERITQDETYYILDAEPQAGVYLGFQEDINPDNFKETLEQSFRSNTAIEIEKFVQLHPAKKHDLFLIPNGTVHSAGAGNLVLEISATPYIFTFKMYDWVRPDLDGKPRPINIDHAFRNLNFQRKGSKVKTELISKPTVISQGADHEIVHLPTHEAHFYDVHRLEFDHSLSVSTEGSCHVLMLVEGTKLLFESESGEPTVFAYAETFVVPAAAGSYTLTNLGRGRAKLIKAFLKP